MHSYAEIDGAAGRRRPGAADRAAARRSGASTGTVVADYFARRLPAHRCTAWPPTSATPPRWPSRAGIDVELPTGDAYLEPLAAAVRGGRGRRGARRPGAAPGAGPEGRARAARRDLRRRAARATSTSTRRSTATLAAPARRGVGGAAAQRRRRCRSPPGRRVAVVGPNADDAEALFGCYSFANHVLPAAPGHGARPRGADAARGARAPSSPGADVVHERGLRRRRRRHLRASPAARGRRGGRRRRRRSSSATGPALFGRGTVRRGLRRRRPRAARRPARAGRGACSTPARPSCSCCSPAGPYAVGWALERCAAVVQAFFPGEEGGAARRRGAVRAGEPVRPAAGQPARASAGAQPYTYLHPRARRRRRRSPTSTPPPACPFGHGLSYTTFAARPVGVGRRPRCHRTGRHGVDGPGHQHR